MIDEKQKNEEIKRIESEIAYNEWLNRKQKEKKTINSNDSKILKNKKKEEKFKIQIGPYSYAKELREYKKKLDEELENYNNEQEEYDENREEDHNSEENITENNNQMESDNRNEDAQAVNRKGKNNKYKKEKNEDSLQELSSIKKDTPAQDDD